MGLRVRRTRHNVVWAAYSRSRSPERSRAQAIIRAGEEGTLRLYVSTLVFVELFKVPDADVTLEDLAVIEQGLTAEAWTPVDLDPFVALTARELALKYGIKNTWDSAILATAVAVEADVLLSRDGRDFDLGSTYEGVRVIEPPNPNDPALFPLDDEPYG